MEVISAASAIGGLSHELPQHYANAHGYIEGMLGAPLRYLYASVGSFKHFIGNTCYLISKDQCYFFACPAQIVEHDAIVCLLHSKNFIPFLARMIYCIHSCGKI